MKESIRKKISQLIIPRLEGNRLTNPSYFERVKNNVEQGIGGFILFGGKYDDVKKGLRELQDITEIPLFIASDLEQGLGQQIEGGTLFPNAMAIGSAINPDSDGDIKLLREAISIMALEANEIGINVVLAPVLDVNTNPKNPIVCTRAFSDNPDKVAWFGREFIKGIQKAGLIACGKHFPGHGDTEMDSHIELPVIRASMERLRNLELYPFIEAIKEEVNMIMVGHLMVEVIDPERPASLSFKIIDGLLRNELGFGGIVVTDAMNMGAIRNLYQESDACLMALKAGADIILHPENPESVIEYLLSRWEEIETQAEGSLKRISKVKEKLLPSPSPPSPPIEGGEIKEFPLPPGERERGEGYFRVKTRKAFVKTLSEKAIRIIKGTPRFTENSVVIILDDDSSGAGKEFIETLKGRFPAIESIYIDPENIFSERSKTLSEIKGRSITVAVFSKVSAWKGRNGIGPELYQFLKDALKKSGTSTVISFGSPYFLNEIEADTMIATYWDSAFAQRAVGRILCENRR